LKQQKTKIDKSDRMAKKILIGLKWLFLLAFLIYILNYVFTKIQPELIFHAQQPPFLKTSVFFSDFVDYPGGLAEYSGNFFAQSFYSSFFGSLVIVSICVLLMLCTKYIASSTSGGSKGFFWMIIPAIIVFYLIHDYYLPFYVIFKLSLAAAFITTILILKGRQKLVLNLFPLAGILLYYLAGSASFMTYLISVALYFLFKSENRNRFVIPVIAVLCAVLIPFMAYTYCFNIPKDKLWFSFMPPFPLAIKYTPDSMHYFLFYSIPLIVLLLSIHDLTFRFLKRAAGKTNKKVLKTIFERPAKNIAYQYIIALIGGTTIIICLYIVSAEAYNQHKKNIVLADYYAENKDWKKVIDVALSDPRYDKYINFAYNRAIANLGRFSELYFNYPQVSGSDGLYPDKVIATQIALPACDFYYEVGYISEALHWAYEAHTLMPNSSGIMKRLVMANLIEGRYQAAATFLSVLKSGFHQETFVNKYLPYTIDTSLASKDPEIKEKRLFMPVNEVTMNDASYRYDLLYKVSKENRRALEYLAMTYLLDHKLASFMELYPELKKGYKDKLPLSYELAVILYVLKTGKHDLNKYNLSEESRRVFLEFNKIYREYNRNKEAAQYTLKKAFGNTYIYYLTYLSPLAMKTENTNEQ
jgi:hypothetical protein